MSTLGELSIRDVSERYNLGFQYARNIVNRLDEIGYIKKKKGYRYGIIQPEQEIDHYIKSHLSELRPAEYDELGIKDNGEHTLRSKLGLNLANEKMSLPLFIRRILFSIPQLVCLFFIMWLVLPNYLHKQIEFFSILQYFMKFYLFLGIPLNILVRIGEAKLYKMDFKEFMFLPENWQFNRFKDTIELHKLLMENNIKFQPGTYSHILPQIEPILEKKKSLAEHYIDMANHAKNEDEFYQSINNCLDTLEWMAQFERCNLFSDSQKPSDNIKAIKARMPSSIKRFHKKMEKEATIQPSQKMQPINNDMFQAITKVKKQNNVEDKKEHLNRKPNEFALPIENSNIKNNTDINYCIKQSKKVKELEAIVNTTIDEKEFALSLNEITRILYDLSFYEDKVHFSTLPSDKLRKIKENRSKTFDLFYQRVEESNIMNKIDKMNGHEFEYFCADILKKNHFIDVEVTQGSGDHGIDILAEKDGITYAIQCKRYSSNIGNAAVQQAHTGKSLYHKDIAVVLTNRYFTAQAQEEAKALGVKLWDRDKLNSMIESSKK